MRRVRLTPGSTPWLLAHELRLSSRVLTTTPAGRRALIIISVVILGVALFGGFPLALWLSHVAVRESPVLVMGLDIALMAIFSLELSQTLSFATTAFFERGDLDLLFSSPLAPRKVLAARAVAIATAPFLWFAALLSLIVIPMALVGQPRWLAVYPVLIGVSLLAAAAGIALAMSLFDLIGARRTRTVGQLLAAVLGAAAFLCGQIPNLLPHHGRALLAAVSSWASGGAFAHPSPLTWPAEAVLGAPGPLAGFVLACAAVFALTTGSLGRRFAANAAIAIGTESGSRKAPGRAVTARGFQGGLLAILLRKELRLLVRDPTLLSQVLLRAVYLLPLTLLMLKQTSGSENQGVLGGLRLAGLAGVVTVLAGQLSGSLAWITLSGEDSTELLASAPVRSLQVRMGKLAAALLPVALTLGVPLGVLTVLSPWVGVCADLGVVAASVSACLVNLWFEKPLPRKTFRNRGGGSAIVAIAELFIGMAWGVTAFLAAFGSLWALLLLALSLGTMGVMSRFARPLRAY